MVLNKKTIASITVCAALGGCGGGAGIDTYNFPAVSLYNELPRIAIAKMPIEFHEYAELHFTMRSVGYFTENPTGHAAMVMRSSIPLFTTHVRGQGIVFGDVSGATNTIPGNAATLPNPVKPSTQIEAWFGGMDTDNFLLAGETLPPQLVDNVPYDFIIQTHDTQDKSIQTIRYTVSIEGKQVYDSGVITDPNKYLDATLNDIYVGHVFDNPAAKPWTMTFTNITLYF